MPTEASEQVIVVRELRRAGLRFCAVPNGGYRSARGAKSLKAQGVVRGVPDLLIFDPPPETAGVVGVALEMKRATGTPSDVTPEQTEWIVALRQRGWVAIVGYGARDALRQLQALGFGVRGAGGAADAG